VENSAARDTAEPPAEAPLPDMSLLAVLLSPDHREAVIRGDDGKAVDLVEGNAIGNWTLVKILPDKVIFHLGQTDREIAFPVRHAGQPAVTPVAAMRTSRKRGPGQ
jgi:hypothetical protein